MQIASVVKDEAEEMFDRIDENGDRHISFEEFSRLMRHMDRHKSDAALHANFAEIDTNDDGRVSFDEFLVWVAR